MEGVYETRRGKRRGGVKKDEGEGKRRVTRHTEGRGKRKYLRIIKSQSPLGPVVSRGNADNSKGRKGIPNTTQRQSPLRGKNGRGKSVLPR